MTQKKHSVAFVCLGNICRSPMAEAIFRAKVKSQALDSDFHIESFGTAGYHTGDTPDDRSVATCVKNGVPVKHRAQQISSSDFDRFDYVLAMDRSNLSNLKRITPKNTKAKIMLLGDFGTDPKYNRIVEDPYYGGMNGFQYNFDQISHFSDNLLHEITGN